MVEIIMKIEEEKKGVGMSVSSKGENVTKTEDMIADMMRLAIEASVEFIKSDMELDEEPEVPVRVQDEWVSKALRDIEAEG